jgi:hypothetical protein
MVSHFDPAGKISVGIINRTTHTSTDQRKISGIDFWRIGRGAVGCLMLSGDGRDDMPESVEREGETPIMRLTAELER